MVIRAMGGEGGWALLGTPNTFLLAAGATVGYKSMNHQSIYLIVWQYKCMWNMAR